MLRILLKSSVFFILINGFCYGDVSHLKEETMTTPEPPPVPYHYQYKAGRFPGHIDRVVSESGDASGVIHGSYSYIDPKFKIRTVDYTADKNGFYPVLKNFEDIQAQPQESEAVKEARERHFTLYQRIANDHFQNEAGRQGIAYANRARDKHLELYNKIAAEHQAIGTERQAQRPTYEPCEHETSLPNTYQKSFSY